MSRCSSRRCFLKSSVFAGFALWTSRDGIVRGRSPNERLNIGSIGVGGRGAGNTGAVASENIAALCDVDANQLARGAERYPQAKQYADWRELVEQKDLDAVVVSSTDHTHAPACVWAMNRGLSAFCEKPLAHSVYEARVMQEVYLKNKDRLATQMGTQMHATENLRRVIELVQSGTIGSVREAHVWCGRSGMSHGRRPEGEPPVPSHLNWDLWLGPAPYRPYHSSYLPGCTTWEQWWDFGNGCLGDMGSHLIDWVFAALKLRDPLTITAEGSELRTETYPSWLVARWQHPARGDMPPLTLHWYDGNRRPEIEAPGEDLKSLHKGMLFVGDKGMLLADYDYRKLLPAGRFQDVAPPEPWLPRSRGHHQEWLHAIKTGEPTTCNFDYSGKLVEHNLLGVVAFRAQSPLQWNPQTLKATNCPAADDFIRRQYREGWTLDG
jgi:predicted dehydrogenase